jgi:putative ABC transport system permease protein
MTRRLANPLIFGVRLSVLFGLYRQRLRDHAVAELLAGGGVAVGVALVFGVMVANGSIVDSVRQDVRAVRGSADLALVARAPSTFSRGLADRVAALPAVAGTASLLRQPAVIEGPAGRQRLQFIGINAGLIALNSVAVRNLGAGALLLARGIGLPSSVARAVGAQTGRTVRLVIDGTAKRVLVRAVLNAGAIGPLAEAPIAVSLLPRAQSLSGSRGAVNEILVKPKPGKKRQAVGELRAIAGAGIDVGDADIELRLAETAAAPVGQSTSLFVAIAAMVGFLLALNAMLLTVPERRRAIADMRVQGYDSRQVLAIAVFQAMALGIGASCVGIAAGEVLVHTIFGDVPSYLATVFPVTDAKNVSVGTVLIAIGCGLLASLLASLSPVFDLRARLPVDAVLSRPGEPGQAIGRATAMSAAMIGLLLVALVSVGVLLDTSVTVLGGVLLALAAICMIPLAFRASSRMLRWVARRYHGGMVAVTAIEMNATATRSVALAGVAALAVYGSIAVGGARGDLLRGLDGAIEQEWGAAPVWVSPDGNIFDADRFRLAHGDLIARTGGIVTAVHAHQGGFLDLGAHRLWIRAVPPESGAMILSSQLLQGDLRTATGRLRGEGWMAVSGGFAAEHDLHVGEGFSLPTPSGRANLRVAAITTNIGWPSGTITLNTRDYARYWQSTTPTALSLSLRPGVGAAAGRDAVRAALASQPGLLVQTSRERIAEVEHTVHQGLSTLSAIATLLLVTAALALAAALSTAIYQRRARLASLKEQGFDTLQLWRGVLLESAIVLGVGCIDGVVFGVYAHLLADRYLRAIAGFPAPFGLGGAQVALTLLVLLGVALTVIALPGYSAAGVSLRASYQE